MRTNNTIGKASVEHLQALGPSNVDWVGRYVRVMCTGDISRSS